jgi:hypothetical protein
MRAAFSLYRAWPDGSQGGELIEEGVRHRLRSSGPRAGTALTVPVAGCRSFAPHASVRANGSSIKARLLPSAITPALEKEKSPADAGDSMQEVLKGEFTGKTPAGVARLQGPGHPRPLCCACLSPLKTGPRVTAPRSPASG